mmetsp:Transcript_575/g.1389  ORF Transcript_575/g.1389 Transcript_575/m.1389 type:complete len:412 (-) Transcript_575:137-1372(-)
MVAPPLMLSSGGLHARRRNVACRLPRPASDGALNKAPRGAGATAALGAACRRPSVDSKQGPPSLPNGVSVCHVLSFVTEHAAPDDALAERRSTRFAAQALRKQRAEANKEGSVADELIAEGEVSFTTSGALAGPARIHVAHAWDASMADLADCLARDAEGDLDRRYSVDVFSTDLLAPLDDPPAAVQRTIAGAKEVLLVLDKDGLALQRLWVLFEAMLALDAGKLRVRRSSPSGFGNSEAALRKWEERLDAADWVLAQATRKTDDKRVRACADRLWELNGKGIEHMLAQLKKLLRREIYGLILVGAVEKGDKAAVGACLDAGASPEQQDAYGNTVEELAAHNGRQDIEDFIFERRMKGRPHARLAEFFATDALVAAAESGDAHQDVLTPFLTQGGLDSEEEDEDEEVPDFG